MPGLGLVGAAATLGAAFISACIALLVVIIAKDQKVSEFRQAWIDRLRDDIAEAISAASSMTVIVPTPQGPTSKMMLEQWARLAAALSRIELRMNLTEGTHKELIACIRNAEFLVHRLDAQSHDYDQQEWLALQKTVIEVSQRLLKIEWDRVRDGEPMYRNTKLGLIAILVAAPLVLLIAYTYASTRTQHASAAHAAVFTPAG